jgi:DNA-binding NarL/FixJ family response regulator
MPIRILLCSMPRVLLDAISAILAQESDMAVVARLDDAADVAASVQALQPDVAVLQEDGVHGMCKHAALFTARADLRVVTVAGAGGAGALYRLGTRPAPLRQPSAAQFVQAVRGPPPSRPSAGLRRGRPRR